MFLPLDRKPDWKNPPLITLIILLANVLCWYVWQSNDTTNSLAAGEYYTFSGLYKTELRAYEDYTESKDKLTEMDIDRFSHAAQKLAYAMRKDGDFQAKLDANEIIKPGDKGFDEWRSNRTHYVQLQDKVVSNKYGLIPSKPTVLTLITNMFLHGSNAHLWGNMVMFVLMGYVVEMILGRTLYLIGYLFSGLTAGILYVLLFPHSAIPGIGASGAIAGVLGMYVVIFGLRKINFFYFLFVYFDYVRAPAILMLPLFVALQAVIQFVFDTNINVAAHIGGLFGGALFAGVLKFIPGAINIDYVDEKKNEDRYQADHHAAMQLLASMKIDEAREKFEALLKQRPNDISLKQQLYTVCKYNPASESYHQYATQLLNLPGSDRATIKIIHDTFVEYAAKARPKPRWTPELMISMATRFASAGYLDDAEKLVNFLIKAKADFHRNPEGLAALAKYFNGKDKDKMVHYRDMLLRMYPDSSEAQHLLKLAGTASG
ncbi:MAG: rhomboid family intramembrane serine protease [Gammaproteobacteria bacterium]|nr:rhomboid family intramembrane serine protease [Gammaproteobacteria bacterium]